MPVHLAAAAARSVAAGLAAEQCAVVSRRQLYAAGVPRWLVRLELRTGRWQPTGAQTVALHDGPLDAATRRWVVVLEAGPRAALDGVSALQAAGLEQSTDDVDFPAYGIGLEVDGSQHDLPPQRLRDLLRDLGLATEGRTTVRVPLLAWRLDEPPVLDGLEALFRSRGWRRPAA